MIKLIGTDHLMSKEEIIYFIEQENPEVIGVELCNTRLDILVKGNTQPTQNDDTLIGKISKSIKQKAEEQKIEYGSDMITASKYAIEHNLTLIPVDRDINEIRYLMEKIPSNELQEFIKELQIFESQSLKQSTQFVDEKEILRDLKTRFPVAYEFLITSRELYIVNQILKLMIKYPHTKILIFLGKGHIKSINEQIEC